MIEQHFESVEFSLTILTASIYGGKKANTYKCHVWDRKHLTLCETFFEFSLCIIMNAAVLVSPLIGFFEIDFHKALCLSYPRLKYADNQGHALHSLALEDCIISL